jgi:hypothetical protein
MLEVLDGGPFAQEFRVRDDGDVGIGPGLMDDARDLVAGAHRHRRFGDDHGEGGDRSPDLARGGIDVGRISMIIIAAKLALICAISHGDHFETSTSVLSLASVNFFLHALTIQR